ncbi:MAG TPA: DUF4139 domain-containing protein [Stellaceae bacterium]|nr:DUF4139 domain-containing protein [Stellaceae bacterium]
MTIARSSILIVVLCLLALPAAATELVVKRVMLSAGGVAYVEREAEVEGDAELSLDVPLDQVDDVLKSIVVYDSAGGVGSAHLPGREPVAQIFSDLPFGADALASPEALLNALQGSEVRIGGNHAITGKLLKVVTERVRLNDQSTVERHRLSVVTPAGLQQVVLEEADSIAFTDAALQAKVERALAAIAEHHAKDRRRIVLSARGQGKRVVRVGYVVAAPLWKSTYRLILPQDAAKTTAHLQGWAVLENMSGEDWQNVELTLFSGHPVSFRQALYEAYYLDRPEVPVEVAGRILPRIDNGVIVTGAAAGNGHIQDNSRSRFGQAPGQRQEALSLEKSAPAPGLAASTPMLAGAVDAATAEEGMTQVAFRIPVPISIKSGESAIVAIVDRNFPARRLALYQPGTVADHPLAAIDLKNDGGSGLPPGVLTVYEQTASGTAYVGDARMSALPDGEDRLLSYAVDEKTKVAREIDSRTALAKVTASRGVFNLSHTLRQVIHHKIVAPPNEARHLIIELPKMAEWTLVEPAADKTQQTATAYRIVVDLEPGESKSLDLVQQRITWQQFAIGSYAANSIVDLLSTGTLDPSVKRALEQLVRLRQGVADAEAEQQQLKAQIQSIGDDQGRLRENLRVLNRDNELLKRYIAKLDEEETVLEKLHGQLASADGAQRTAKAALDDFIASLEL